MQALHSKMQAPAAAQHHQPQQQLLKGSRPVRSCRRCVLPPLLAAPSTASTSAPAGSAAGAPSVSAWEGFAEQARACVSQAALGLATLSVVGLGTMGELTMPAEAKLTSGDPIKSPQTLLRNALPINNKPIRELQKELESISAALRIPGSKSLGPVVKSVRKAKDILAKQRGKMEADFAADKRAVGMKALDDLKVSLDEFSVIVDAKDKQEVPIKQREALEFVGIAEEAMVKGFPFEVPKEYAELPQLLGRAKLEMKASATNTPDGKQEKVFTIILDGLNAPVSAGAFMDLVERGFYNGMNIQRSDGFVVQTGDPDGPDDGFRDPKTGEIRRVPFEARIEGEKEPLYELTLQDLGRVQEQPVLPFDAYGTLAWARNEFENNSASSQVFFLLKESELTPSGANLLDGRFAVFGYVVNNQDAIGEMTVGDKIEYIKVLEGAEFLKNGPDSSK